MPGPVKGALSFLNDVLNLSRRGGAVYHSGSVDEAADIARYGVEPQLGPWVKEVLSGAVDDQELYDEIIGNSPPVAWWSETPSWVESKIRRRTGRSDVTDEDIAKYGHLAVLDPADYADEMYRVGPEGLSMGPYSDIENLLGERMKLYDTDMYRHEYGRDYEPFGVEVNEIITPVAIEPTYNLTGGNLVDFLRRYRSEKMPSRYTPQALED